MREFIIHKILFLFVLFGIPFCIFFHIQNNSFAMGNNKTPTAIVIDAETKKPIEGAVAIAIWRRGKLSGAWFEGGTLNASRVEEAISDKEGHIYIDDFWDWHLIDSSYPRLTIYKPGYVCWDQKSIYIDGLHSRQRTDFDKGNTIVRMKKWPKDFSFVYHEGFVDAVTRGETFKSKDHLFRNAFDYEIRYRGKERLRKNRMERESKTHQEKNE